MVKSGFDFEAILNFCSSVFGGIVMQEISEELERYLVATDTPDVDFTEVYTGDKTFEAYLATQQDIDWKDFFDNHSESYQMFMTMTGASLARWFIQFFK